MARERFQAELDLLAWLSLDVLSILPVNCPYRARRGSTGHNTVQVSLPSDVRNLEEFFREQPDTVDALVIDYDT